jgi:hypothetical protein
MEARLQYVLGIVSEHLKFAEAKNAAILAANAATVIGLLQIYAGAVDPGLGMTAYLGAAVVFSSLSGICALLSFLPQTHIPWLVRFGRPKASDSLLFFGDIQRYSPQGYLDAIRQACPSEEPSMPLEIKYAQQIVINARIAARKFTYFRYAIWLTLAAVATPLGALALYFLVHESHEI